MTRLGKIAESLGHLLQELEHGGIECEGRFCRNASESGPQIVLMEYANIDLTAYFTLHIWI